MILIYQKISRKYLGTWAVITEHDQINQKAPGIKVETFKTKQNKTGNKNSQNAAYEFS